MIVSRFSAQMWHERMKSNKDGTGSRTQLLRLAVDFVQNQRVKVDY